MKLARCCSSLYPCKNCRREDEERSRVAMEEMIEYFKHRDAIFNGLKPDCSKCNDSGWVRCNCKDCK